MKSALFQNHKVSYTIDGQGDCLVLLHGFPMDSRVWTNSKQRLAQFYKVICIDLPGFGQSEMLGKTHSMQLMAEAVNTVLEHEKIDKCVLVGHSMGGYASLEFANRFPEKLKGLVLYHSQAIADDETARENRNKAIQLVEIDKVVFINPFIDGLFDEYFAKSHPEKVDFIKNICVSQSEKGIIAALAGMRDRDEHLGVLAKIQIPVLFIMGKNDKRMPFRNIMEQAQIPQHAELLILDNVAHFGFIEKPSITGMTIGMFTKKCFTV